MRARRRRSVLNTVAAAVLEVAIMGLFVIIAQPQLRDALFEILHAGEPLPAAQANVSAPHRAGATTTPSETLDRTLQAVANSPVAQAIENSLSQWANGSRPEMNVPSLSAQPQPAPSLLSPNSAPLVSSGLRDQPGQRQVAGYSPYEQYESFRVDVPTNNQPAFQQPVANSYAPTSYQQYAIPQYVPPQSYGTQSYSGQNHGQGFTQNYAPTQLNSNQWNIASAAQSPRPNVNGNTNNWIPPQVTETSFRQVYPPPYGTQSMWK